MCVLSISVLRLLEDEWQYLDMLVLYNWMAWFGCCTLSFQSIPPSFIVEIDQCHWVISSLWGPTWHHLTTHHLCRFWWSRVLMLSLGHGSWSSCLKFLGMTLMLWPLSEVWCVESLAPLLSIHRYTQLTPPFPLCCCYSARVHRVMQRGIHYYSENEKA